MSFSASIRFNCKQVRQWTNGLAFLTSCLNCVDWIRFSEEAHFYIGKNVNKIIIKLKEPNTFWFLIVINCINSEWSYWLSFQQRNHTHPFFTWLTVITVRYAEILHELASMHSALDGSFFIQEDIHIIGP